MAGIKDVLVILLLIDVFAVHLSYADQSEPDTSQGVSAEEVDVSIISDLHDDGLTVVDWARFYQQYGGGSAPGSPRAHTSALQYGERPEADDLIFSPDYGLSRHKRATQDNDAAISGEDNPCDTNATLCSGVGQECVYDTDSAGNYRCQCRDDYEIQASQDNLVCVVIPDSKKLYLTTTLDLPYDADFNNQTSLTSTDFRNETQEAFLKEFTGLEGYKTLQVLQYRNATGKTQIVYALFFTTDVASASIVSVAERVLSLEDKEKLEIGSNFYNLVGFTGVFSTQADTQAGNDTVDWCSSSKLYSCDSDRECKDGGVALRYSCDCKKGSLDVLGECVDENEYQYDLYPFGAVAGDTRMAYSDDGSEHVFISTGFPIGTELVYDAYIGINGLVAFKRDNKGLQFDLNQQDRTFCPYQADIDTFNSPRAGEVYFHLYQNKEENRTVYDKAQREIREFLHKTDFTPRVIVLVTWETVPPYGSPDRLTENVTFQAILVSDGSKSYGLVYYKTGAMNWAYKANTPVIIGISRSPSGKVDSQPVSNTEQAFSGIDRRKGNTGRRGMWVYEIGEAYNADQECEQWYQDNLPDRDTIITQAARLPRCPCTSVGLGRRWVAKRFVDVEDITCYRLSRGASRRFNPYNKECCFRREGNSAVETLVQDLPYAGGFLRYNPAIKSYRAQYRRQDRDPHGVCCFRASPEYCVKYYELRPIGSCSSRAEFGVSNSLGDPHITTPDGKDYTFNGWGEYTMLTMRTNDVNFTLQGRTEKAVTDNGTLINATVFTAFAAREGSVTAFVQLEPRNKKSMIIFVAEKDYTLQFQQEAAMLVEEDAYTLQRDNDSLVVTFPSGISLTISVAVKLLDIAVSLPNDFSSQPKGLLGNFNNAANDDFMLPNGTVLPGNLTEREVFNLFGKTWAITDAESIFRYEPRKGPADFRHPDFVPVFLDEASDDTRQEAENLCGSDNIACIYDFIATGSRQVAQATKDSKNTADETEANLKNTAPEVTPNTTSIKVSPGEIIPIQLVGSDAEDGSGVTYMAASSASGNYQLNSNTGLVTYNATSPNKSDNLGFYVVDSKNIASPVTAVQIVICPLCNQRGNCDVTRPRPSLSSQSLLYASCNCSLGWDGDDCELDFNGCSQAPCIPGQECLDIPADIHSSTGKAFNCSACPTGYVEDDGKCRDSNECASASGGCEQLCINTEGSFYCACNSTYRLDNDGQSCTDINECAEKSSDCDQICINVEGGFNCSCEPGYSLQASNNSCLQNAQAQATCESANCSQGCRVNDSSSSPECFCQAGYKENATDSTLCVNEDECQAGICSQKCQDSVGSFACSCYPGFRLGADQTSCLPCRGLQYGEECREVCSCNGRSTGCDPVTGCECQAGWRGTQCESDVDECADNPSICGSTGLQICVNTPGSYSCECLNGYTKDSSSSQCTDIDECADDSSLNTCGDLEECQNTNGGFYCACRQGYETNSAGNCTDIDECRVGTSGCQQICTNNEGSYVCGCRLGYRLAPDRRTCESAENVCAASTLTCNQVCSLDDSDQPFCFCHVGYRLGSDLQTCFDIDECSEGLANCTDTCSNKPGSFLCSCPAGKRLLNDQRTCRQCENGTFGVDCRQSCRCGVGADRCDPQTGCVCSSGWTGQQCDQDIDECQTPAADKNCTDQNAECTNIPGSYTCTCALGYQRNESAGTGCEDVDECSNNPCGQRCENTPGSYRCLCNAGFSQTSNNQCEDIDECRLSSTNDCSQRCINTAGSYRCACNASFTLDNDGVTCRAKTQCSPSNTCDGNNGGCFVETSGNDTCICNNGYKFVSDSNFTCVLEERNWCWEAECEQNCANTTVAPYFNCSCNAGFQLNDDRKTCRPCPNGRWGEECSQECTCNLLNIERCRADNGSCECKTGWTGTNCDQDIDECADPPSHNCGNNSQCSNTNGSFICVCDQGYYKVNSTCTECDNWFFDDCAKPCACNKLNSVSCNKQNGTCTCNAFWEGENCTTDIDECSSTNPTHNCTRDHEVCRNQDLGFTCECATGYTYNTSGLCEDRDECLDTTNNCSQEAQCSNTEGGFICTCLPGYQGDGYTCQNCTPNTWGSACRNLCTCNTTNTVSCDKVNGTCYCKPGWTGANCSQARDECESNPCPQNSTCFSSPGSLECTCNTGFNKTLDGNCTDIDECADTNPCDTYCNNTMGSFFCSCDPGYALSNNTCQDIDECDTETDNCDQVCNNTMGGFTCHCRDGFLLAPNNRTCDKLNTYNFILVIDVNVTEVLKDNTTDEYRDLKKNVEEELFAALKKTILGLVEVIIISMKSGSLITDARAVVNSATESESETDASVSKAFADLKNQQLNISNQNGSVSNVTVNGKEVIDACSLFPCESDSSCQINTTDNRPYCRSLSDGGDDYKLIIGLGVGIPLFFIAFVAIAFVIYVNVTGRKKQLITDDDRSMASGILSRKIATRAPFWDPSKGLYSPDNVSSSSSEEYRGQRSGHGGSQRPDYDTSLWSTSPRASPRPYHSPSNFSWDFLYNQMPSSDQPFAIKRPKVESTANPTYDNAVRGSSTS